VEVAVDKRITPICLIAPLNFRLTLHGLTSRFELFHKPMTNDHFHRPLASLAQDRKDRKGAAKAVYWPFGPTKKSFSSRPSRPSRFKLFFLTARSLRSLKIAKTAKKDRQGMSLFVPPGQKKAFLRVPRALRGSIVLNREPWNLTNGSTMHKT